MSISIRNTLFAAGGALALGLFAGTPTASAATVGTAAAPLVHFSEESLAQDVRWVRQCRQVRRWWNGRRIWVQQCRNVWVPSRHHRPHRPYRHWR